MEGGGSFGSEDFHWGGRGLGLGGAVCGRVDGMLRGGVVSGQ